MPVSTKIPLRRLSQAEFGEISYFVMGHVFAIHRDLGRFFDEAVYKRELGNRIPGAGLEVPIDIAYGSFHKRLLIDVVVDGGAVYELKTVEQLANVHRAQVLQYLMLRDLSHGKLTNMQSDSVEHEFVNTHRRHADRCGFEVDYKRWGSSFPGSSEFRDFMVGLLRDLGTGLTIPLYEEAATGGEAEVRVARNGQLLGKEKVRLVAPETAVKVTAFEQPAGVFEGHARRWFEHVDLRGLAWLNIGLKKVTFTLIAKA